MFKKLIQHSLLHAGGRVIGLIVGVVSIGILARYLGQEQFGWYVIAFTWLQFFAIAVDFGLYMTALKMLGEAVNAKDEDRIFAQFFWLRLFSACILVLILPQIVWLTTYPHGVKVGVVVLALSFFFATINQLLTVRYQQKLQMQLVALTEIIGKVLALIVLYVVVLFDGGYILALVSIVFFGLVQMVVLFFSLPEIRKIPWVWDYDLVLYIFKQTWPLGVIIVLNTVYFKIDTLILSWVRIPSEVGMYGAAYKVLEIMVSFPAMYLGLLLPHLSGWWKNHDLISLKKYLDASFSLLSAVVWGIVPILFVFADDILGLVVGDDFRVAGIWLRFLSVAGGAIFFGQLFGYVLVAVGKQKTQMYMYMALAGGAIVLYGILIPIYGTLAAASVTVFLELLATVFLGFFAMRTVQWRPRLYIFILGMVIGTGAGVVGFVLSQSMPWIIAAVSTMVIYGIGVLGSGMVPYERLRVLLK